MTIHLNIYPDNLSTDEQMTEAQVEAYCNEYERGIHREFPDAEVECEIHWNVSGTGAGIVLHDCDDEDDVMHMVQHIGRFVFENGNFWEA